MIKAAVIDDQHLVRQGIVGLLALTDEIQILWESDNGSSALIEQRNNPAEILLMDIRMPEMNGIEVVEALRKQGDETPVLMLTTFDDSQLFLDSMRAGANGFLLKDVTFEKLVKTIKTIASGGFVAEPLVLNHLRGVINNPLPTDTIEQLSDKELDVLKLIAAGFSNREIAETVHLAEGTVKNHVSNILSKMDCRDRTRAVLKAMQMGLLKMD